MNFKKNIVRKKKDSRKVCKHEIKNKENRNKNPRRIKRRQKGKYQKRIIMLKNSQPDKDIFLFGHISGDMSNREHRRTFCFNQNYDDNKNKTYPIQKNIYFCHVLSINLLQSKNFCFDNQENCHLADMIFATGHNLKLVRYFQRRRMTIQLEKVGNLNTYEIMLK